MKYSLPRGTKDILPNEVGLWQEIEKTCRQVFEIFGYSEIRTPVFEPTGLFTRSIGTTTDIVSKEMYTFEDKKGRSLTLRPEETAPVVRACLEHNLISTDKLTKLYYIGPMFRYERPQAGRQRQFHQAGIEAFGSNDPLLDVEVIQTGVELFKKLGLSDLEVDLNSVGCKKCQPKYLVAIRDHFKKNIKQMCFDCGERLKKNPMRILDCKQVKCQKEIKAAPAMIDFLCDDCKSHFDQVLEGLKLAKVNYKINKRLVRGLDYYTKTAFEIVSKKLGAQNAICGGGRYDNLVEELGGKAVPAIGFAIGLERIIEILKSLPAGRQGEIRNPKSEHGNIILYIATMGERAKKVGFDLLKKVRDKGLSADMDYLGKSLKAQMKTADRINARYVYIIGEDELDKKLAVLKDMQTGQQKEVGFDKLIQEVL